MIVGAALVQLHVHGSRSLKQKRGVVRSITRRVRNEFNLAVAEVGGQDTWQRVELGLAAAGHDARVVRRALERALEFIEALHLAEVVGSDVELLDLPHAGWADMAAADDEDDPDDPDPYDPGGGREE